MTKNTLILYSRDRCPLCDKAKNIIVELQKEWNFHFQIIDIAQSDELTEKYGLMIPVVELNGEEIQYGQIDKFSIIEAFEEKSKSIL